MPSKEELFREVYGDLSDEEIEAYGGMIFRQLQEQEQAKINKERDPFQDIPIGRYPKKEKEDLDRQVGEDIKRDKIRITVSPIYRCFLAAEHGGRTASVLNPIRA